MRKKFFEEKRLITVDQAVPIELSSNGKSFNSKSHSSYTSSQGKSSSVGKKSKSSSGSNMIEKPNIEMMKKN